MTYKILANKWRPKNFVEIVGQSTAVTVLQNSLVSKQLHHAYLFTGTRGVGKTTIARILAKAMICAQGISATPCNECSFCVAVDAGNAIDVLEIDAASRTKLEDTKVVLDNLSYAPSMARFKIYIIDEVHMLSNHSFNALLKTLEEPPGHVKFLLATTDPQKLPITVLSRCLQFKLQAMNVVTITEQLAKILTKENIQFEQDALVTIAEIANGSMRDAISLLEQVLAFSGNKHSIMRPQVAQALHLPDEIKILELLTAITSAEVKTSLEVLHNLFINNIDPNLFLAKLQLILKELIVLQLSAQVIEDNSCSYKTMLTKLVQHTTIEELQLYAEIMQHCCKNLPFNPDLKIGLEMMVLRMIAFNPLKSPQYHCVNSLAANHDASLQPNTSICYSSKVPAMVSNNLEHVDFPKIIPIMQLSRFAKQLAMRSVFEMLDNKVIKMIINESNASIINDNIEVIRQSFSSYFGVDIKIVKELKRFSEHPELYTKTAEYYAESCETNRQNEFRSSHPSADGLIKDFDGTIEILS